MSDERKPVGRLRVSDGLIAALKHFSTVRFDWSNPHYYRYTLRNHRQQDWSVEDTCANALALLEHEDGGLAALKFEALRQGLKEHGLERAYERIMGEPIDKGAL